MSHPKTNDEAFTQDWNKAVAWAQTQGISASDYLPVYQMDQTRLQQYGSYMSAGERNRAILAAANPNDVTPAPSDNPSPSNVFDNARSDLASIVTGLEPQHLVTGLFDTVKNTVEAVADPRKEDGSNIETTAANWMQNTLLSFVPGLYDVGTYLRADPKLTGAAGFAALADHPLVSLLDLIPADKGFTGVLSKTAAGERLAEAGGQTAAQMAEHGLPSAFSKMLTNHVTSKEGFGPGSAAEGVHNLTVGERLQLRLQDSRLGTSAAVQHLMKEYMLGNQIPTAILQNALAPAMDAYSALSEDDKKTFQGLKTAQDKGGDIQQLLKDPKLPLTVVDAFKKMLDAKDFLTQEELVGHGGDDPGITAVTRPDGSQGFYSSKQVDEVFKARDALADGRRELVEDPRGLDNTDHLMEALNRTDSAQVTLGSDLDKLRQTALAQVPKDDALLENATQEFTPVGKKKPEILQFRKKKDQASYLFGPQGPVDQLVQAMTKGEDDKVQSYIPILRKQMSRWYEHSVDVEDAALSPETRQAFTAVKTMIDKIEEISKNRQKMNAELDRRIIGEGERTAQEEREYKTQANVETKNLEARHVAERKEFRSKAKTTIEKINAARQLKLKNLDDLYERMKDAKLTQGDQAAERATKEQADAIYQDVKRDLNDLRQRWFESKNKANKDYDKQVLEAKLMASKAEPKLKKRQEQEKKDLKTSHDNGKEFHGNLTRDMRHYSQLVKEFQQAVYDHPSDEYVGAEVRIYQKHLMEHQRGAELVDATEKRLKEESGWEQSRVDALHQNEQLLREEVDIFTRDVLENPLNFEESIWDAAKEARTDAKKSAVDELNSLIAEGYHPMWFPSAGTFDRPASAIKTMPGKGVPHVDAAMARVHDMTATRHNVFLGVSKAMAQALTRDANIEMAEHMIAPRAIDGASLMAQLKAIPGYEHIDTEVGTNLDALGEKAAALGLKRFDSKKAFGFTMPRWEGKAMYLPEGLVDALEKMHTLETKNSKGFFDKTNQVFRYSILGLSPRYTAHILFGGTFLLALRSTPYMPFMLLKAAKAMKEGKLPEEMFRQPAQEGYGRMQQALYGHGWAGGQQLANMVVGETIEKTQGILLHKASPFHYLKAAADVNFRFTRYATRMQTAVAYLDHMAKAERKGYFLDEVTGERMEMTKERAMYEGMRHVEQVFGDLRSMSPLERQVAKNMLPFYGWTRHILKYVLTMPVDHPWRAMTLALIAYENSEAVPKGLPERLQFLFFLGSPDKQGNVSAIDTRFMDPLRDVANYASLGGWIQGLNPVFLGPAAMMDPQLVYGSTSLYPNLTYNNMYGIETAGAQGSALQGVEQFIPQLGALGQALGAAGSYREAASNPNSFYKSIFNSLNIPFAQVQKVNLKQMAAKDETARYEVAKTAAQNAFQSGDFSMLKGYSNVPNPLNPDYEISVQQLEAVYNNALAQYPGQAPINVLLPPATPSGY